MGLLYSAVFCSCPDTRLFVDSEVGDVGQAFLRQLLGLSLSLSRQSKDYEVFRLGAAFLSDHLVGVCHIRSEHLATSPSRLLATHVFVRP